MAIAHRFRDQVLQGREGCVIGSACIIMGDGARGAAPGDHGPDALEPLAFALGRLDLALVEAAVHEPLAR